MNPTSYSAAEVASRLDGEVVGDGTVRLTGFAPADRAREGDLTFAESDKYFAMADASAASAVLVPAGFPSSSKVQIRVANPRVAFARVLPLFFPESGFAPGIHPSAVIAPSASVDPSAHVGPHCAIGERVRIGPRCALVGGNHVGDDCVLGEDTLLFANVVLYARTQVGARVRLQAGSVLGADGFGYVLDEGQHRKVPQIGHVIIHDDVEVGANTTIDRGALGATIIGKGTKIDNLVQIGHNVVIGEHCIVVAQNGISGSTRLGNYVVLAGQVGLAGHLKLGNRVTVAAQSGVMSNIPDGETWLGSPARPDRQAKRIHLTLDRLPDLLKRVAALERQAQNAGPAAQPPGS